MSKLYLKCLDTILNTYDAKSQKQKDKSKEKHAIATFVTQN
jgi:hypothetical protein